MTIDFGYSAAAIAIVAVVTGLVRAVPYLLFGGKKEIPAAVQYLGTVLPASIMIVLVIYCLRDIDMTSFPFGMAELVSVVVIIAAQVIKKNTFLSVLMGTACYMLLIRTVFAV